MIYVRIEMWPKGFKERAWVLGEAEITNTGEGTPTSGKYTYKLFGKKRRPMGEGVIDAFPRKRLHVWNLVLRMLYNGLKCSLPDPEDDCVCHDEWCYSKPCVSKGTLTDRSGVDDEC